MGLWCHIKRHYCSKHLCGYVTLPSKHPWRGLSYDNIPADCHGGITYHGVLDQSTPNVVSIGFDCAHGGDLSPVYQYGGVYRDINYVRNECARLARQVEDSMPRNKLKPL